MLLYNKGIKSMFTLTVTGGKANTKLNRIINVKV